MSVDERRSDVAMGILTHLSSDNRNRFHLSLRSIVIGFEYDRLNLVDDAVGRVGVVPLIVKSDGIQRT